MKKLFALFVLGMLFTTLTACGNAANVPIPANGVGNPAVIVSATPSESGAPIPTPTPTLTPAPDTWQSMPIVPTVSATARRIYENGRSLGNDPHAFSIVGDCLSLPINLFGNYGKGPAYYNLGDYTYLQPVIDWFLASFARQSESKVVSVGDGFNTAAVLSPFRADPKQCQAGETPLACEYRINRPSYVIISLGTDDYKSPPETYEARMRQIVEYTISQGIVPILATKADNREGNDSFNGIIANLAYEYDVPLWNFWLAVKPLSYGVVGDEGHLYWADPNHFDYANSMEVAIPIRTLTALQVLGTVWQGVSTP